MSASVVAGPVLRRIAPRASSPGTPMAASTCEGATLPDEQAEPDDTATPSRSKPITSVSALPPGIATSVVLGSRSASAPKITASGRERAQAVLQPLAQRGHVTDFRGERGPHGRRRGAERGDCRDVLGARARAALLTAPLDHRIGEMQRLVALDQRARALRAAQLMGAQRQQVCTEAC